MKTLFSKVILSLAIFVVLQWFQDTGHCLSKKMEKTYRKSVKQIQKGNYDKAVDMLSRVLGEDLNYGPAYIELGRAFFYQEEYDSARESFQRALELVPEETRTKYWLARLEQKQGNEAVAEILYKQVLEADSDYSDAALELGKLLYNAERYREALPYLKIYQLSEPDEVSILEMLGKSYREAGKYQEAADVYRRLRELRDKFTDTLDLAEAYRMTGEFDRSLEFFQEGIDQAERNGFHRRQDYPLIAEAFHQQGLIYKERGEGDAAVREFNKAIEMYPLLAAPFFELVEFYKERNDIDAAVNTLKKLVSDNPNLATAHRELGELYLEYDKASKSKAYYHLKRSFELDPYERDVSEYIALLEMAEELNADEDFEKFISDAIIRFPKNVELRLRYGNYLKEKENYDKALEQYKRALVNAPDDPRIYRNLGALYFSQKEYDQAILHYEQSINLKPDFFQAIFEAGLTESARKNYQEAADYFQKALELNPDDVQTHYNLGFVYDELGRYRAAAASYQKAIELNPSFERAYNNLGITNLKLRRYNEAEENFLKVLELNPKFKDAAQNLVYLYKRQNKISQAREIYQKYIQ